MNEDREWTLNNVEQICIDTKDIDEICFGLEQLTIFATENIQNFATTILKLNSENQQLKEKCEKQQYAITENCDLRLEIEQSKEQRQELRSWLEEETKKGGSSIDLSIRIHTLQEVLNRLEGKND